MDLCEQYQRTALGSRLESIASHGLATRYAHRLFGVSSAVVVGEQTASRAELVALHLAQTKLPHGFTA